MHTDKIHATQRRATAHQASPKQEEMESALPFQDNRPQTIAQRKLQAQIQNSQAQTHTHPATTLFQNRSAQTVQRMILPVGDLQELLRKNPQATEKEKKSAKTISESAKYSEIATKETIVRPWDERQRPFYYGPLAEIGATEQLRIYGHGEKYKKEDDSIAQIGGYTPEALYKTLVELGLPKTYKGEIYLTGCETAKGEKLGYLGVFYQIIVKHCPGVSVRGNLARSTTFEDGKQGVWTGVFDSPEALQKIKDLLSKEAVSVAENVEKLIEEAQKEKDIDKREKLIETIKKESPLVNKEIERLDKEKEKLLHVAYSTDGSLTRVLPG